jgi:Big-like domain-containing protein
VRLSDEVFTPSGMTATAVFDLPLLGGATTATGPGEIVELTVGPGVGAVHTVAGLLVDPNCPPPIHPTATAVACAPSPFAPGDATACTATVTDDAARGATTPTGVVTFAAGGGRFAGSPCTLAGTGAVARCTVLFTAFARGGQTITAAYGGDRAHASSSGATPASVAVPASTPGCRVLAAGELGPGGVRAHLVAHAKAAPPRGSGMLRSDAVAGGLAVRWASADGVVCTPDAGRASVFGRAIRAGEGPVDYRLDLTAAPGRGSGTVRLRLGDGYDSGVQPMGHGTVAIRVGAAARHDPAR